MNVAEVMSELESMGSAKTRELFQKHGAPENLFGVKIADLKKIVKKVKKDQALAEELFATGNGDARYLAGLIADPKAIPAKALRSWARLADWGMVSEYTVAGVAAESPHGWKLGLEWIDAKKDHVAIAGWSTLAGVIALRADEDLDQKKIKSLLAQIKKTIHAAPNGVRYTMNSFVIAVGCYVIPLSAKAREVAKAVGKVDVDMGDTSNKVPFAPDYIDKVVKSGRLGKKRKKIRC